MAKSNGVRQKSRPVQVDVARVLTHDQLRAERDRLFEQSFRPASVSISTTDAGYRARWEQVVATGATRDEAEAKLKSAVRRVLAVVVDARHRAGA